MFVREGAGKGNGWRGWGRAWVEGVGKGMGGIKRFKRRNESCIENLPAEMSVSRYKKLIVCLDGLKE